MKLLKSDRRALMFLMLVALVCVCVMIFRNAMRDERGEVRDEGLGVRDERGEVTNLDSIRDAMGSFDPNTVDSVTLLKYGLGPVQIHSLMGYRRHGGKFETPLAVSKLYNWSDEDIDKVIDCIVIGEEFKKTYKYREQYESERREEYNRRQADYEAKRDAYKVQKDSVRRSGTDNDDAPKYVKADKFKSLTKVDINTADTTLLKKIPGVGTGIANSIIKLRSKLGGFYSVDQLRTIDYISPELYEWFEVKSSPDLHLININKASFQTLNAHPYISYNQTRDLVTFRRLYGNIKDKEALISTHIFTKEEVERLSSYLEY